MTHPSLSQQAHRPWPIPPQWWSWRQSWRDLLFAHWPVPVEWLRPYIPPALELQQFDGTAWLGIVPFRMAGVMRRPLPDLPWISAFPELNVRTYVTHQGKDGVWFFSLDATNPLAVWAARRFFHLPYYNAAIELQYDGARIHYRSQRANGRGSFRASYQPTAGTYEARPGSLEHWLTERYSLYAQSPRGTLYRAEVHHVPWPLQPAQADILENRLLDAYNHTLDSAPSLLHFARRIDVIVWSLQRLDRQ